MKKLLVLIFFIPAMVFAQKTQYSNYVTSTQQDTSVLGSCAIQVGNVTLSDNILMIDGVTYSLKADSSFTDFMDFTDTFYNSYAITIRQYPNGPIEQIIIQDADDNSKAYCIR